MVELVVQIRNKGFNNNTKPQQVKRYDRGDVIDVLPNNTVWSIAELSHPDWRIIRVNMTMSEAQGLRSPELDPAGIKINTWKRGRKFDLDSVLVTDGKFKTFLLDDTRAVPVFRVTGSSKLFTDITVIKPPADTFIGV